MPLKMQANKILTVAFMTALMTVFLTLSSMHIARADDDGAAPVDVNIKSSTLVKTAPVRKEQVSETITAYGTVEPDPSHTHTVAMPHEGVITGIAVRAGEVVKAGDQLVTIETSPGAAAQYQQAQAAVQFAENALKRNKRLFTEQLATRDQLAQAQKDLADAQAQLNQLKKMGSDQTSQVIRAPFDGIVTRVAAAPGDRLQADAVVLTIGSRDSMIVALGIEPEDASRIKTGAAVHLVSPLNPAIDITAKIDTIYGMVNPSTRLVDALVQLSSPATDDLVLGMTLKGAVAVDSYNGFIVPHAALSEDANGNYVFTVSDGKAHRVPVQVLFENGDTNAVKGDLHDGARVVVSGNAALEDSAAVRVDVTPYIPVRSAVPSVPQSASQAASQPGGK